jgi:hypothetical protein
VVDLQGSKLQRGGSPDVVKDTSIKLVGTVDSNNCAFLSAGSG